MTREKILAMQEEFAAMIAEEERRLEEGQKKFMERHLEIMEMIDQIRERNKKRPCQRTSPAEADNPTT